MTGKQHSIQEIAKVVIAIRKSKLPDPKEIGNSGSFFKNPILSKSHFETLLKIHPELPNYTTPEGAVKIPAAWLIEKMGFKGIREGDAGVHRQQALVLVNYKNATGNQIIALARKIQKAAEEKFTIKLETEVNIL